MFSFVFYIFYELFDSYDATRVSYRRFVGKTGREETGNTEKRGAFRYVVAMKTGNAQYLSNAAEVYVSEISKRICPGLIRASGERTYRFFKRAFDLSKDNIVGLVLFLSESVFKMKSARCRNKSHAFACICRTLGLESRCVPQVYSCSFAKAGAE